MALQLKLPDFGHDWLTGLEGLYIIMSLKYSDEHITMFWRSNSYGYTDNLAGAGKFTETNIRAMFAGGGMLDVALPVPCTRDAFATLGLYPIVADYAHLERFAVKVIEVQEKGSL